MNGASTLGISSEKVCYIIAKARQFEAKDVVADPDSGSNPTDDGVVSGLEDQPDDPVYEELIAFIAGLNRMSRSISLPWPGSGAATLRSRNGMIFAARRPAPATTAPPPISSACRSCPSIWRKAFPNSAARVKIESPTDLVPGLLRRPNCSQGRPSANPRAPWGAQRGGGPWVQRSPRPAPAAWIES